MKLFPRLASARAELAAARAAAQAMRIDLDSARDCMRWRALRIETLTKQVTELQEQNTEWQAAFDRLARAAGIDVNKVNATQPKPGLCTCEHSIVEHDAWGCIHNRLGDEDKYGDRGCKCTLTPWLRLPAGVVDDLVGGEAK